MRLGVFFFVLGTTALSAGPSIDTMPLGDLQAIFFTGNETGTVYVSTSSGSVFQVEPQAQRAEFLFQTVAGIQGLEVSPTGRYVTAPTWRGTVLWDRTNPEGLRLLLPPQSDLVKDVRSLAGVVINRPGTMAIIQLEWDNGWESWTKPYLATFPELAIVRPLDGTEARFTDEGTRLVQYTVVSDVRRTSVQKVGRLYDWEGRVTPGTAPLFRAKAEYMPWDFRKAMNQRGFRAPLERLSYGWNEFGLVSIRSQPDGSGHTDRTLVTLVPGRAGGPDLSRFWDWNRHDPAYELGFRPDYQKDKQSMTIARVDAEGKALWTKKLLGRDLYSWAQVSPDERQALLLLKRPRPGEAGQILEALILRTVDWRTGEKVGDDVAVPDLRVECPMGWDPAEGWIAFGSSSVPTLYWPAEERWASWSGLDSYQKGVRTTLARDDFGGVLWTRESVVVRWGSAPGQVGGPVELALRPDHAMFFEIDESGQSFIRRMSDGAVLARVAKGEVFPDPEPLLASVPEVAPGPLPAMAESRAAFSDKYRDR